MMAFGARTLIGHGILLGDQGRFVHMGRHFQRGGSTLETEDLLVLFGVLCVLVVVVWLFSRYLALHEKQGRNSPRRIFRELCRAHRLGWADRQLMRQLARWHRLPSPSLLFLDAPRFEVRALGPAFARRARQLTAIRERLFGDAQGP
ncbi:MAG: hypothetical protein ACC628_05140 [Pirellulaceae bacterium]